MKVLLVDGPFHGQTVEAENPAAGLLVEGDGVPEGSAAQYKPTRDKGVLHYRGITRIMVRIPMPEKAGSRG